MQIFCIFLFTYAASLFGTLLGQIQQVFATLNKKAKDLEDYMEGYQSFFWDYKWVYLCHYPQVGDTSKINWVCTRLLTMSDRVTNYVKQKVQRWVHFQYFHDASENRVIFPIDWSSNRCTHSYEMQKREVMLDPKLPEVLRTKLAESLSTGVFSQVTLHINTLKESRCVSTNNLFKFIPSILLF